MRPASLRDEFIVIAMSQATEQRYLPLQFSDGFAPLAMTALSPRLSSGLIRL
jgi:hypothetical protein